MQNVKKTIRKKIIKGNMRTRIHGKIPVVNLTGENWQNTASILLVASFLIRKMPSPNLTGDPSNHSWQEDGGLPEALI